MKIEVEVIPDEGFTIVINGTEHRGCRLVSRWEGMAKFMTADGFTIIIDNPEPSEPEGVLRWLPGAAKQQSTVIKASPGLFPNHTHTVTDGEGRV